MFFSFLISGLNLQVAQKPDEVEILKEEIAKELTSALGNIKLAERGVYVQASTLGALEALLDFLKTSKIPVSTTLIIFSFCIRAIKDSARISDVSTKSSIIAGKSSFLSSSIRAKDETNFVLGKI